MVRRYTTSGQAWRKLGELVGYKAKSWKQSRRVIARKQHDPRTNQMDLRLIQCNIGTSSAQTPLKPDSPGNCGELSLLSPEDLYEKIYCGRAKMEQAIGEFKPDCFGARASATRFSTNSFRMILAMLCQLTTRVIRVMLLRGLRHERKKEKLMGMTKFRRDLIWVTSQINEVQEKLWLTLPEFMLDEKAFLHLFNLRIA